MMYFGEQKGNQVLIFILVGLGALTLTAMRTTHVERVMLRMETQSLHGGKRTDMLAELYYQTLQGRLVTRYLKPAGHVLITNDKGELVVYDEKENTVFREQGLEYSTGNNLLYFFLSGKVQDLGLRELGFRPGPVSYDDGVVKTDWLPDPSAVRVFSKVVLVHENHVPIYAAYYDKDQAMIKKVYYTGYSYFPDLILPMQITEFNYLPGNDSIISRIRFSDVQINSQAQSPWFQFVIPENAKLVN